MKAEKFWVIKDNTYKGIKDTLYETYDEAEKEKESIKMNGLGVGKIYDLKVIEVMVVFEE